MTEDTLELVNDLHLDVNDLLDFLAASGDGEESDAASPLRRLQTEARDLARRTEALDGPDHAVQTQAERIQRRIERIYQEARSRASDRMPEKGSNVSSANVRIPKISEDHIELMQRSLREIIAEQAYSADDIDDEDVDDEWVDWVETYEEAIEGIERLGVDPYDDPLEWREFLDPIGDFKPEGNSRDEGNFLEYLANTYGVVRS